MEEVKPLLLRDVYKSIAHEIFSKPEITRKEKEVVSTLQYQLLYTTSLQFFELYLHIIALHLSPSGASLLKTKEGTLKRVKTAGARRLIMAMYDYEMLKYRPSVLAMVALRITTQKLQPEEQAVHAMFQLPWQLASNCESEIANCTDTFLQLEKDFPSKYRNLTNLYHCLMPF